VFGQIDEFLNWEFVSWFSCLGQDKSFPAYVHSLAKHFGTNEIFCTKASWDQLLMLLRWKIHRMFAGLKVIYIYRQNTIAQGVSLAIAWQTQKWTSQQEGVSVVPVFDYKNTCHMIDSTFLSNVAIPYILQIFEIDYRVIVFEEFLNDMASTI